MKSRRQALKLCLDTVVVVIVKIFDELLFEVFHRFKLLQIKEFTLEQTEEVFYYSVVQTVTLAYVIDTALISILISKYLVHPLADMSYYLKLLQYTEILFSPVIISQYIPVAPLSVPNETQLGSLPS